MAIRVLLFGALADVAGWRERTLEKGPATLGEIRELVTRDDPALGEALARPGVRAAIDRVIAVGDAMAPAGAEIAFMPVMSGG